MLSTLTCQAAASVAYGQEGDQFTLLWAAPGECPTEKRVRADIDNLLGGPAGRRLRARLEVEASVKHAELWRVTLDTVSAGTTGHRSIEASTCEGLANATALIVALMIDPDAVAARSNKPKPPEPPPVASPAQPGSAPPTLSSSSVGLIGAGTAGTLGVLPAADVGATGHVGLQRRWLRVELQLYYGLRRVHSEASSELPGAYGEFGFYAAMLRGCWVVSSTMFEVGPCAAIEAGLLRGQGIKVSEPSSETTPWLAMGAGGVMGIKAGTWLRFPVHLDAIAPVLRSGFVFRNVQSPILRSWRVGVRLAVSAELQF